MKNLTDILKAIGIIGIAVFLWIKLYPLPMGTETVVLTDTTYSKPDTVQIIKTPAPVVKYKDTTIYETEYKFKDVDTAAILRDYYAEKFYSDVSTDDSTYWIRINDTISQNRIAYRNIEYSNLKPTQIINNYNKPTNEFYIGLNTTIGRDQYFALSPTFTWKTKKENQFGIGYDLINKDFSFQFGYNLKKLKK